METKTLFLYVSLLLFFVSFFSCSRLQSKNEEHKREDVAKLKAEENAHIEKYDVLIAESLEKTKFENLALIANSSNQLASIMANCYMRDFTKAREKMNEVYEQNKNNASYWGVVGNCYSLQNDNYAAILYYKKALEIDAKYLPALNNLGVLFARSKDFNRSLRYFQDAHEISPQSVTPMLNLAELYLHFGHPKRAIIFYETLYSFAPFDLYIAKGLLQSYVLDKRIDSARKYLAGLTPQQKEYLNLNASEWVKYVERP